MKNAHKRQKMTFSLRFSGLFSPFRLILWQKTVENKQACHESPGWKSKQEKVFVVGHEKDEIDNQPVAPQNESKKSCKPETPILDVRTLLAKAIWGKSITNYEPRSLVGFFNYKTHGFPKPNSTKPSGFRRTLRTTSFASGDALFQQSARFAPQLTRQRATSGYPKRHASINGWCSWPPLVLSVSFKAKWFKTGDRKIARPGQTHPYLRKKWPEWGQSKSYRCLDDDFDL